MVFDLRCSAVMIVSVSALADVLVEQVNPRLPEGCWLERGTSDEWGGVWLFMHTAEGSWGGSGIASLEETITDVFVAGVVEMALDAVQDDVAHATQGIAWPADPNTTRPLPERWARVEAGVLSFGYGSQTFASDVRLADLVA
jgi:hypothetical protein